MHANESAEEQRAIVELLWRGAEEICERLVASESMTEEMRMREGFMCDVCEDGKGGVMLIELIDFWGDEWM